MRYDIREGAFDLPSSPRADRSIQILEFGEGQEQKAVVVAREIADLTPEAFLGTFVAAHCARKPRFKLASSGPIEVAGLTAHEAVYAWVREGVAMTTALVAFRLDDTMLTISVTGHAGEAKSTLQLSRHIAKTFRCRRPE